MSTTVHRQLAPYEATGRGQSMAAEFRWVHWCDEPITREMAEAHLRLGADNVCVVRVRRGPQGGWTGARFLRRHDRLPNHSQVSGSLIGTGHLTHVTLYCGWYHPQFARRQPPVPVIDHERHLVHLVLHARAPIT